jgi:hypothetical protein
MYSLYFLMKMDELTVLDSSLRRNMLRIQRRLVAGNMFPTRRKRQL